MSRLRFSKSGRANVVPRKDAAERAQAEHQATIQAARQCLKTKSFIKYAEQYAKSEQAAIEAMFLIDQQEFDPDRYAFKMKEVVSRLRQSKLLFNSVRADAGVIGTKDEE